MNHCTLSLHKLWPPNKQKRWNCEKSTVFYKCRTKKTQKNGKHSSSFLFATLFCYFLGSSNLRNKNKKVIKNPQNKNTFVFFLIFRRAFFIFCNNKGIVLQKSFELYSEGIKLFFKRGATTDIKISSSLSHASFENTYNLKSDWGMLIQF